MEAGQRVGGEFGVGTGCGLGRRLPETIEPLMRLHAEIAAPVAVSELP